jgi:hypothetical protein
MGASVDRKPARTVTTFAYCVVVVVAAVAAAAAAAAAASDYDVHSPRNHHRHRKCAYSVGTTNDDG